MSAPWVFWGYLGLLLGVRCRYSGTAARHRLAAATECHKGALQSPHEERGWTARRRDDQPSRFKRFSLTCVQFTRNRISIDIKRALSENCSRIIVEVCRQGAPTSQTHAGKGHLECAALRPVAELSQAPLERTSAPPPHRQ